MLMDVETVRSITYKCVTCVINIIYIFINLNMYFFKLVIQINKHNRSVFLDDSQVTIAHCTPSSPSRKLYLLTSLVCSRNKLRNIWPPTEFLEYNGAQVLVVNNLNFIFINFRIPIVIIEEFAIILSIFSINIEFSVFSRTVVIVKSISGLKEYRFVFNVL